MYITEVAVTSQRAGGSRMKGEYGPTGSPSLIFSEELLGWDFCKTL